VTAGSEDPAVFVFAVHLDQAEHFFQLSTLE
jgi:hypothetical protein